MAVICFDVAIAVVPFISFRLVDALWLERCGSQPRTPPGGHVLQTWKVYPNTDWVASEKDEHPAYVHEEHRTLVRKSVLCAWPDWIFSEILFQKQYRI